MRRDDRNGKSAVVNARPWEADPLFWTQVEGKKNVWR
jgi:hypothetical protein